MKKRVLSGIFVLLCLFALSGCSNTGETPVYGEYLGRNIDECYEAWKIEPQEDISLVAGDLQKRIILREPADYLGKKFFVQISYSDVADEPAYYSNKLDSVTYIRDYYKMPKEEMVKDAVEVFAAIKEKFGASGESISLKIPYVDKRGGFVAGSKDEADLTEERLLEWAEAYEAYVDSNINTNDQTTYPVFWEWYLPEEYEKLDADFIEQLEEFHGEECTYCVKCSLEYREGHFVFSIKHSLSPLVNDGL